MVCVVLPSALGTWHCSRSKKNGSASTSTQTTTATHPPKAPVAHQSAHQKRTSRPHTKAHTKSHIKPHISTAHDGTESRTSTETAHLKRTWGILETCLKVLDRLRRIVSRVVSGVFYEDLAAPSRIAHGAHELLTRTSFCCSYWCSTAPHHWSCSHLLLLLPLLPC